MEWYNSILVLHGMESLHPCIPQDKILVLSHCCSSMEWYSVILVTPWNGIPAVFLLHGMVLCHSCHTMERHPSSLLTPWNGTLSFLSHHGMASQQSSYSMEWYPVILVTPWNGIPAVFLLHGMVSWQFQQGGVWWTRILWTFSKQLEQVSNLFFLMLSEGETHSVSTH